MGLITIAVVIIACLPTAITKFIGQHNLLAITTVDASPDCHIFFKAPLLAMHCPTHLTLFKAPEMREL